MRNFLAQTSRLIGIIALILCFVAAGLGMCCIPSMTEALSGEYATDDNSPFSKDQLKRAAVVTADYTMLSHDEDALYNMIRTINREIDSAFGYLSNDELKLVNQAYTIDEEALSHLDDCFSVVEKVRVWAAIAFAFAIVCLISVAYLWRKHGVGTMLVWAGGLVLACFAALGVWAAIDFDGLFAMFHSLFFEEGTWTFSSKSLLICMLPENLWIGMGAIWLLTTGALSIFALVLGIHYMRRYEPIYWPTFAQMRAFRAEERAKAERAAKRAQRQAASGKRSSTAKRTSSSRSTSSKQSSNSKRR